MKAGELSRRHFLKVSALGVGALVAVTWVPRAESAKGRLKTRISRNHGHRFTANLNEVIANGPHTYKIRGFSLHPHEVTLTQEMINTLVAQKTIDVESTHNAGHSHWVRFEII